MFQKLQMVKVLESAAVAVLTALLPSSAFAAGTATGVEAGFFALGTDLNTILTGAGGFVLLIASVFIGGAIWAFTGRATGVEKMWGSVGFRLRHISA